MYLDERVLERIGELSSTHTAERFRLRYGCSPCNNWHTYREVALDMGIPIPGGDQTVLLVLAPSSSEEESDEESEEEESDDEERPLPRVPDAVVPLLTSKNETSTDWNGSTLGSGFTFTAFIASGVTTGNAALAAFMASGANETRNNRATATAAETSNKRAAATAATDSSKKLKTGAEQRGKDNRPAWLVQMERKQLVDSFLAQRRSMPSRPAASPQNPYKSWGKPQSTASRSATGMSWGSPNQRQSTASRSAS